MGSKEPSVPDPPQLSFPPMTNAEREMAKVQLSMARNLQKEFFRHRNYGIADRSQAMNELLPMLMDGPQLSDSERATAVSLADQYYKLRESQVTGGAQKEILDRARRDTLGSLVAGGVVNSTTGRELLGDVERERMRLMDVASQESALKGLETQLNFLNRRHQTTAGLFDTLFTSGTGQAGQLSQGLAGSTVAASQVPANAFATQRVNAFNVNAQNAQAQYLADMQRAQLRNQRSGMGGVMGALGTALGAGTAALIPGGGLAGIGLGAGIGGSIGQGLGGFF